VHVHVHFSWVSVFLGSTPFNVQLDVRGTKGSPHPSYQGATNAPCNPTAHPPRRGV